MKKLIAFAMILVLATPAFAWPVLDNPSGIVHYAQSVAEASTAVDAVPVTENQEVVVEYGNWIAVILEPIREAALTAIPAIVAIIMGWLAVKVPFLSLFVPRQKVNDLVENAVKAGLSGVQKAAVGKKLTVNVTNDVVRAAIVYMLAQAPSIVKLLGDSLGALIQKVLARLPDYADVPVDYTVEKALKAVTKKSVEQAAAKADVTIDEQLRRQLGG